MRRRELLTGSAALASYAALEQSAAALGIGRLGAGMGRLGSLGGAGSSISIPDTNVFPTNQFSSGSYLAVQTINNQVLTRSQSMTIVPTKFPNATVFNASWPAGADGTVKSYNAIDYGNYFDTIVPVPVASSKLSDIITLKELSNFTYVSGTADAANVTIDGFLYSAQESDITFMLCEFQVFFHLTAASKSFVDGLTQLGTYTSASIDGTPSIAWKVGRQASNFQGVPYYLFYPIDLLDKPVITFDINAMFTWLRGSNPTTGLTYLTGNERYNGHSLGIEPMKDVVAVTINTITNTYTFNVPTIATTLPVQPNLISTTNLLDASWTISASSTKNGDGSGITDINGSNGQHSIFTQNCPVTGSKAYSFQVDIDVSGGWPYVMLQLFKQDFSTDIHVFYHIPSRTFFGLNNDGFSSTFTAMSADIQLMTNGKTRLFLNFTTDAGTTNIVVDIKSATAVFGDTYTGVTGQNLKISNPLFYDPSTLFDDDGVTALVDDDGITQLEDVA
jgi:hypothetical protein